jgi:hypothetical protein
VQVMQWLYRCIKTKSMFRILFFWPTPFFQKPTPKRGHGRRLLKFFHHLILIFFNSDLSLYFYP